MTDACDKEIRSIAKAKVKVMELNKKFQAKIKDFKKEADDWAWWLWKELESARNQNEWLLEELHWAHGHL